MAGNKRSGRKRKPTDLKVLQGTFRSDRHADEVQVPAKWPLPPDALGLTKRQSLVWEGLRDGDVWHAETDWPAVWGLVIAIDELIQNHEAQRETDTAGHPLAFEHILREKDGTSIEIVTAKENPLKTAELKFLDRLYKYITLNGRSPADRARMPKPGEAKPQNPLERFIKKA